MSFQRCTCQTMKKQDRQVHMNQIQIRKMKMATLHHHRQSERANSMRAVSQVPRVSWLTNLNQAKHRDSSRDESYKH